MRPKGMSKLDLEVRRRTAIRLVVDGGMSQVDAAAAVNATPGAVSIWMKSFRERGQAGLHAKPDIKPRPSRLDDTARVLLDQALRRGASAYGFASDLWTGPRIQKLLARKFQVEFHVTHVLRIVRSMGWTLQRPQRRAREQDAERVREWRKKTYPALKKKRGAKGARSSSSTKAAS